MALQWEVRRVRIEDDFALDKILDSGQCFRPCRAEGGAYRFVTGRQLLWLRPLGGEEYEARCAPGSWEAVWQGYFDLGRSYAALRQRWAGQGGFVQRALGYGAGIRVLRQDPWEMLITFILSQRKSIPAIRTGVELLAARYGEPVAANGEAVHLFPTPAQLAAVPEEGLRACGLGYRTRYIQAAARAAASGALDLAALAALPDEALLARLLALDGVGKKVANCVALFGYGRTALAPVDVWIARLIEEDFAGQDPFPQYGAEAGILQQYFFYYKRNG